MTPGRPCVFPITFMDGVTYHSCFDMNTPLPACLTKLRPDDTNFDQFGYCRPDCAGELPGPGSEYNLALATHTGLWSSHFYDLRIGDKYLVHSLCLNFKLN